MNTPKREITFDIDSIPITANARWASEKLHNLLKEIKRKLVEELSWQHDIESSDMHVIVGIPLEIAHELQLDSASMLGDSIYDIPTKFMIVPFAVSELISVKIVAYE